MSDTCIVVMSYGSRSVGRVLFEVSCAVCGRAGSVVCAACESGLSASGNLPGSSIRSRYVLDEACREIVVAFKYRRERRLAEWAASRLAPLVPRCADAITWLPSTPRRVRRRGYDQASELAMALSRQTQVPATQMLQRAALDDRQTGRTREQRMAGPSVHATGKSRGFVVLVDDVVTTGASLARAGDELRSVGAERVVAVTFAATPRNVGGLGPN